MTDRVRAAMVCPYPKEEGTTRGGVEAVTHALSEALAARDDLDIHVITLDRGADSHRTRTSSAGATIHILPMWERLGAMTRYAIDVRRIRKAIDLSLIHI